MNKNKEILKNSLKEISYPSDDACYRYNPGSLLT